MKRHANLSIFVPQLGCPHQCSFCNQVEISGHCAPAKGEIAALCEAYLPPRGEGKQTEIAFFGGSFTAIPRELMVRLLQEAAHFVEQKRAAGIRLSTRPDAISAEILDILKAYHVTAIELGAQSMDDEVLRYNGRGHSREEVKEASHLIKKYGFSLGLQMMIGLPGGKSFAEDAQKTADAFCAIHPDTVRIYPTLVLEGTQLGAWWKQGCYQAVTLDEAVKICAKLLLQFEKEKIRVIRVGLHDEPSLKENLLAGPYHPAFRQLCESRIYAENLARLLSEKEPAAYTVQVAKGQRSTAAGQKNSLLKEWAEKGFRLTIQETDGLTGRQVRIISEEEVEGWYSKH